jgi:hypothetical protein
MDPLAQALEMLRQVMSPQPAVSNMVMIRQLVAAEFARLESPAPINFIGDAERELFEQHQDTVQAFLASDDGIDAWGLLVEAFRAHVDPPAVPEPEEMEEE